MQFVEIIECIRDFHSQLNMSDLLNMGSKIYDFEDLSYEEIHERLDEYFTKEE
ncbi:hypothetical protein O8C86_10600 [Aliarcobacter butzleri]|uniref:hypothetical protein n=1 Tax=Aliarcobacter butzleri TaxID=28197 RepID=UPI00263F5038|nr:hypothetical protein [Aliarcobacter butzleri]MDN5062286.1 hypothetical protein [Aliarcobacter butzleri]